MIEVTCAIIEKDNRILAAQRSAEMRHPLKWEFPGGKVLGIESFEDCLKREIKEELGLELIVVCPLPIVIHEYKERIIRLVPFVCSISGGELFLAEHADIKWCEINELLQLDWLEADIIVLDEYLEWRKYFKMDFQNGS